MDKYICKVCATIYDPVLGDSDDGIAPETPFENLPEDWVCPVCGSTQDKFEILSDERYQKLMKDVNKF